jgi:hypothetical protein
VVRGTLCVESVLIGALGIGLVNRSVVAPPDPGLIRRHIRQQRFGHRPILARGLIRVRGGRAAEKACVEPEAKRGFGTSRRSGSTPDLGLELVAEAADGEEVARG